jgi:hypothetical protein
MSIAAYNAMPGLAHQSNNNKRPLSTIYSANSSVGTRDVPTKTREQSSAPADVGDLDSSDGSNHDYDEGPAYTPSPYATNNPPLVLFDNMADTISAHRQQETDWSMIYTGRMDLLFYNPMVQ